MLKYKVRHEFSYCSSDFWLMQLFIQASRIHISSIYITILYSYIHTKEEHFHNAFVQPQV